ncbi:heme-binding protein [Geodermatophilus sp. SYSU D00708]
MGQGMRYEEARAAAEAALARAAEIGVRVSVAVVDLAGHEVVVARGDGTPGFTPGIARSKAATAAAFRRPSWELAEVAERRPEVLLAAGEHLGFRPTTLGGGLPVLRDGEVVGGVGVSGATPQEDTTCAEAAVAVLARA